MVKFGSMIHNITSNGTAKWSGDLAFLNTWQYTLGAEILVARGRQELFDSGVLHYYNYGALYNTSTKIVARTTTEDRMLKSAEYFVSSFILHKHYSVSCATKHVRFQSIGTTSGFQPGICHFMHEQAQLKVTNRNL